MTSIVDRKGFHKLFDDRSVNIRKLERSSSERTLAGQVNKDPDSTLRTRGELDALFDSLDKRVDADGVDGQLTLRNADGTATAAGRAVDRYLAASTDKQGFFDVPMYMIDVQNWPSDRMRPVDTTLAPDGALLRMWQIDPRSNLHLPPPGADGVELATRDFSLKNSGNFTLHAPKPSWKFGFKGKGNKLHGMDKLNAKADYNDPTMMRQTLAYELFRDAGVPAPRTTYARVGINNVYRGLHTLIEQVDEDFLKDRFGQNDKGNLYKGYWSNQDVGPASLAYRKGADGDDSGKQYRKHKDVDERTYRLQTNVDDPQHGSYDDLATFIKTLNGVELPGGDDKFNTRAYQESVEEVFNAKGFLRWAATNMLLGAWDNYYATPANYYLYNSGKKGDAEGFDKQPYFNWIPWDYDNSLGIDFFSAKWQHADIVDFKKNTKAYYRGKKTADIPLLDNLLKNDAFKQYYLDALEHQLDTSFNPEAVRHKADGLWRRVEQGGYLEADTEHGPSHTGRQFSNREFYTAGHEHWEMQRGGGKIEGIEHYVRMRHDSARAQLAVLRQKYPKGASGAVFDGKPDKLPDAE